MKRLRTSDNRLVHICIRKVNSNHFEEEILNMCVCYPEHLNRKKEI